MKLTKRVMSVLLSLTMLIGLMLPLELSVSAATTVTEVRATVSTPVVGANLPLLNDTYTPTEGVEITDLNWTNKAGSIYPSGTKFAAGMTYYCDMEFTVKEGYTFPNSYTQLEGYINGVVGEISTVYYTDHAYVTAAFTPVSDGEVFVAGIGMNDGDYLPMGGTSTTKSKVSDRYAFYNDGVLTLHNYSYRGTGRVMPDMFSYFSALIVGEALEEIVVEGRCDLTSTSDAQYGECIWFKSDDAETPDDIRGSGDSLLNLSGPYTSVSAPDGLTLQDANLSIKSNHDGIKVYGDTVVKNSTVTVNAVRDAWFVRGNCSMDDSKLDLTSDNASGLCVYGDTTIDNSTIDVNSQYSAIYTGVYDSDASNSCDLAVMNSDLTLVSRGSYGIRSDESALLYNSTVNVESMYTGIHTPKDLSISGSQVSVQSSDDSAVYCGGGNMFITSSDLLVNQADNDGITFNGDNLYITSSQVEVTNAADCGIECWGGDQLSITNSELALKSDYGIYTENDLFIDTSLVKAFGGESGICNYQAGVSVMDSDVELVATAGVALWTDENAVTFGEGLIVQAATEVGGTPVPFDPANADNYAWVKIAKAVPLTITKQPTTGYAKMGEKVAVMVEATGEGLAYVWYVKNEGASKYSKSSVTGNTYAVTMSDKVKNRLVFCRVYDTFGNEVKSETVRLREAVSVTAQPTTGYAKMGEKVAVGVVASGDGLKYTWYVKNEGASKYTKSSLTSAKYTVTMSDKVKNRLVYCVVTDKYGKEEKSKTVRLRETVSIVTEPKSTTVANGATAKTMVKASGDGLTYTWYVKNEGASKYTKSSVTKSTYSCTMNSKSKNRLVYCVVTDKYGNKVTTVKVRLKMK